MGAPAINIENGIGFLFSERAYSKYAKNKIDRDFHTKFRLYGPRPWNYIHTLSPEILLTKEIPMPKFLTCLDYFKFNHASKNMLEKAFHLTELGKSIPEVVQSYEDWYNCAGPYALNEEEK